MKLPLARYSTEDPDLKVFSYVVEAAFTPLDLNVATLVQEFGWDPKVDRLRIWNIPKMPRKTERNCPYLILKKLDREQDVLLFGRIDFSPYGERRRSSMAISMLCNDDEYPDRFFSLFVNQPPSFHSLDEFRAIQKAWVNDEYALSQFKSFIIDPSVAKEALLDMSAKEERRILEYHAKKCYYPVLGEGISPLTKKRKVAVQVATETKYHQLTLTFEAERSGVSREINKMLRELQKVKVN